MSYTVPCFGHQFRRWGCFPALPYPPNWCKQKFFWNAYLPRYRLLSHKKLSFFVKALPSKKMTTFYDYKQSFCTLGTSLKTNYPPQRGISVYLCDFFAKTGSLISGSFLGMKLGSSSTMEPDYVKNGYCGGPAYPTHNQ